MSMPRKAKEYGYCINGIDMSRRSMVTTMVWASMADTETMAHIQSMATIQVTVHTVTNMETPTIIL
jgi:hypothetical protein